MHTKADSDDGKTKQSQTPSVQPCLRASVDPQDIQADIPAAVEAMRSLTKVDGVSDAEVARWIAEGRR